MTARLEDFVALYSHAPIFDQVDQQAPRSVDDILSFRCDGYVRGIVTGARRSATIVPLGTGAPAEPPNFSLDQSGVGVEISVQSASTGVAGKTPPGSTATIALPVVIGKPDPSKTDPDVAFVRPLVEAVPTGSLVQVFVMSVGSDGVIEPCWGPFGVIASPAEGKSITTFAGVASDGAVYGVNTMEALESRTRAALALR